MKLKNLSRIDFPIRPYLIDIKSLYNKVNAPPEYQYLSVKKEFLAPQVVQSFELSAALLFKSIQTNNQAVLSDILEPKVLFPKLSESLIKVYDRGNGMEVKRSDVNSSKDLCKLQSIMLYETLVINGKRIRPQEYQLSDFKQFTLLSAGAIKRKLLLNRKSKIQDLISLKRVVRVHCIMNMNIKTSMIKQGEVVIGNQNTDQDQFEKRLVVFESNDFLLVNSPMIYNEQTLHSQELLHLLETKYKERTVQDDNEDEKEERNMKGVNAKKHKFKANVKKQEILEETKQDEKGKLSLEYLQDQIRDLNDKQKLKALQNTWKIVDIDYWLNGNKPYL